MEADDAKLKGQLRMGTDGLFFYESTCVPSTSLKNYIVKVLWAPYREYLAGRAARQQAEAEAARVAAARRHLTLTVNLIITNLMNNSSEVSAPAPAVFSGDYSIQAPEETIWRKESHRSNQVDCLK